jgi:spore maturation protein SpmA
VLNWIFLAFVLGSVVVASFTGNMGAVSKASLDSTVDAIQLVIKMTGGMILFLGLVRVASQGGMLRFIVRLLRPIMRRLFPEVPEDHPAMGAMIMNFAANIFGLGNAATPFGIKAMIELNRLNEMPGVATNAMALFLAINTSAITLFPPTGTIMLRLAAGSKEPFVIWVPTLLATACSTLVAVTMTLLLARLGVFRARPLPAGEALPVPPEPELPEAALPDVDQPAPPMTSSQWLLIGGFGAVVAAGFLFTAAHRVPVVGLAPFLRDEFVRDWLLPLLIAGLLLIGVRGRVPVYDALIEGGKEGLDVAVRIAPYLVAILVAIGMFRASGAMDLLIHGIEPLTNRFGVPAEALPMAILRPLSGSGAFGVMADILKTHGPDSFVGLVTSTLQGSTETTFYVLAVYLGAIGVRDTRHILPACLAGDLAGFIGAVAACHLFFGGMS